MGCLGNILWFIFGGFLSGFSWILAGVLWCVTIVGIPVGVQCFKFASLCFFSLGIVGILFGLQHFKIAKLALMPFGAEVI